MHTDCKMSSKSEDEKTNNNFFCPGCGKDLNFEHGTAAVHYCKGRESKDDDSIKVKEDSEPQAALWSSANTIKLINSVKDLTPKIGSKFKLKTKKEMWQYISKELKTNEGHQFTPLQVENRWKSLERGFRNTVQKKGKRKSKISPFQKQLEPLIKMRHTEDFDELNEKSVSESSGDGNERKVEASFMKNFVEVSPPVKNGESKLHLGNEFKQFIKMKQKQHEDKMELRKTQIRLFEERTKEIKRKNDLLEKLVIVISNNSENLNVDNIL